MTMKRINMIFALIVATSLHAASVIDDIGVEISYTVTNGKATIDGIDCGDIHCSGNRIWVELDWNDYDRVAFYERYFSSFSIPESVGGYPVAGIGQYAFDRVGWWLQELHIPNTVVNVADGAFSACYYLAYVRIPESLCNAKFPELFPGSKEQQVGVVMSYPSLSVEVAEGTEEIGSNTFYCCRNICNVILPRSIKKIGKAAFGGCNNLSWVSVPNMETWMGIAFADHYSNPLHNPYCSLEINDAIITELTTQDVTARVSEYAFNGYEQLKNVELSDGTVSVGMSAFSGCTQLTNITFSASLTTIEARAFSSCYGLSKIRFPDSFRNIGTGAFSYCTNLTSIVISPNITNIAELAFSDCPINELQFSDEGIVCELPVPSREYFVFKGWKADDDDFKLEVGMTAQTNKSYHALWEKDGIVITSFELAIPDEITVGDEYYQLLSGDGVNQDSVIAAVYDQGGDLIENTSYYWTAEGDHYTGYWALPAGNCTITVIAESDNGLSGSASRTIKINKAQSYDWYHYYGLSFGDGYGYSYDGYDRNLGTAGSACAVMITDYSSSEWGWTSISVYRDDGLGDGSELVSGHDYSIYWGHDGGGQDCQTIDFKRAGRYRIDIWTSGDYFEDDYACYYLQSVSDSIYVYVEPLPISEITFSTECDLMYTWEEIVNAGTDGNELFDGKLRLIMSDSSAIYVLPPIGVLNAGTYQLTVGAESDRNFW